MKKIELSIAYLRLVLRCRQRDGRLVWKRRTADLFSDGKRRSSDDECRRWNQRYAGKPAGTVDSKGYLQVKLGGRSVKGHRIVWALTKGAWPRDNIDHRNGRKLRNRATNLRDATYAQNSQNLPARRRNSSGLLGVTKKGTRWQAQIAVDGSYHYLGLFKSRRKAHAAYRAAKTELHSFQPVPRAA